MFDSLHDIHSFLYADPLDSTIFTAGFGSKLPTFRSELVSELVDYLGRVKSEGENGGVVGVSEMEGLKRE
jgi:hypothetical protein